jgi:PAS domain S-box-containing protein
MARLRNPDSIRFAQANDEDFRHAFKSSLDGIIISDCEGRVRLINPALTRVTGMPASRMLGRKAADQIADGTVTNSATLRALETGKPSTVRAWTAGKKEILASAVPVFNTLGCLERIVCNVRNVAELYASDPAHCILQERETVHEHKIVAASPKMLRVLELAGRIAAVDANVLITGATGVGKGLVARFIYHRSRRAGGFVNLNCAAIPPNLFESELFGYEKGAFTGALSTGKSGFVEMAHKGILFLDEVGDLSTEGQAKLLSVIEDRQVTRVGGRVPQGIDVRVIAATNKDLARLTESGSFRQDLYFRLAVVPLHIPPLCERREDIRPLVLHYLGILSERYRVKKTLDSRLWKFFDTYSWPGNARELAHLVEYLFISSAGRVATVGDLPDATLSKSRRRAKASNPQAIDRTDEGKTLRDLVREYELDLVREAVEKTGSYVDAARLLGTSLATLNRRLYWLKGRS